MIVDSRAISLQQTIAITNAMILGHSVTLNSERFVGENAIQSHEKMALVSIRDSQMPKTFQDYEDVCVVEFADIEPININVIPPADSEYMTDTHAQKILDFINKWHNRPERVVLLVHCQDGICRSGAVVSFVGLICGLGYRANRRRNPDIIPNHWVQYQLFKTHFERRHLLMSGSLDKNSTVLETDFGK